MPALIPFVPLIASGIGAAAGLYSGYKADQRNQQIQNQMQQTQDRQMGLFDQAQQVIPGMANIANAYGQAAGGFLGDRNALAGLQGQYGGLMDQMNRLYNTNLTGDAVNGLRGVLNQGSGVNGILDMMRGGANVQAGTITDGGYGARLGQNAQGVMNDTNPGVYRAQARLAGNDAMGQLAAQMGARGILSSGTHSRLGAATLSRLYADAAARGQQDRLNAYGISNSALGAAGNMALNQSQGQVSADLQAAGIRNSALSQMGNLALNNQGQQASLWGQLLNAGLQQGNFQAGLLGQMGNMLGAQQGNVLAQSGLLGNYLQGLQGQSGMLGNIANLYNNQAAALGGMYQQQGQQVNQNPYGGFGAALGSMGNAAAQYLNWQAQQQVQPGGMMLPPTYTPPAGATAGPFRVAYPGIGMSSTY